MHPLGWFGGVMDKGRVDGTEEDCRSDESSAGIVVTNTQGVPWEKADHPRIAAFIWGGKVRPAPTLPYGRWRGAA